MSITNEQWQQIEEALKGFCPSVQFQYGEFKISIGRARVSESKHELCVYINDEIQGTWFTKEDERPSCIPNVWRTRTKSMYTAKQIKEIEKVFGKRQSKKYYPNLHKKHIYYSCMFSTAKSLVRQYKKLDGLKLWEAE